MTLHCYVVDDEGHAINVLKRYIENTPELKFIGSNENPVDVWNKIEGNQILPDLLFLDVDMPQLSGIELAELIRSKSLIIFTTAHPDYALEAYETDAIDYLVKPIAYERFLRSIGKVKLVLNNKSAAIIADEDYFYVKSEIKGKMVKIGLDNLIYVEAKGNYLQIMDGGDGHLVYLTLKELEEKLPSDLFIRIHKSFIVSLRKIKALEGNTIFVENGHKIMIGAKFKANLLSIINPKLIISKRLQ
jgi:DNA-binding LytR/AlgR family response regulator